MYVLGISAFYHDSAAALLRDGDIVAAAQEERFSRRKHDSAFPANAIRYCLREAGCEADAIDHIAFYDKPFLKFERLLETYLAFSPRGFKSFRMSIPVWLREKLFQKHLITRELTRLFGKGDWEQKLLFSEHHLSHAASAFYPSPFEEAVVLTMDGVGEWATTSVALGSDDGLKVHREIHFPHSLGLLYSAFTYYTGFRVNSGEYKLMGLAPYGSPVYADRIREHLIDVKEDGSFRLDLKYFDYCTGLTMTNRRFDELFGRPPRQPEGELTQFHMDIAASIQQVTEEVVLKMVRMLARSYDCPNLCLAGGVALNCVANGRIESESGFGNLWVQPASGDAGGALGAAYAAQHLHLGQPRTRRSPATGALDAMSGGYLGPAFTDEAIESALIEAKASYRRVPGSELIEAVAQAIADDQVVGWMQGRMEFGPRALGARSILGNAASTAAQRQINLKIKYRESFRPFAPAVLRESVGEWFDFEADSPYMMLVKPVKPSQRCAVSEADDSLVGLDRLGTVRSRIPAVTHVDYSARLQTVHRETNPLFHALIERVGELTGTPVIVNTSFNVRGEPIVCTPADAFRCFMGTEMDLLAIGHYVLLKSDQDPSLKLDYRARFEAD
ncbi:MAG: carbamoyltransferase [Pseudomonadales bacterium]